MKKLLNLLIVLGALAGALLFIGFLQPADGTVRCQVLYRKPVQEIWATVVDFKRWPEWNPNVERVESAPTRNTHPVWKLKKGWSTYPLEVTQSEVFKKLETFVDTRRADSQWTWDFKEVPAGTELTITQQKHVASLFLRGILVFHDEHDPILDAMVGLGKRHGLEVRPMEADGSGQGSKPKNR